MHYRCTTPLCTGVHNYPMDPRKMIKCGKCRKMVSLQEGASILLDCEEYYRRGAEHMDVRPKFVCVCVCWIYWTKIFSFIQKENTSEAIKEFVSGIELFYTVALAPHKNTHIAQESLRTCLADQGSVVTNFF